MQQEKIICKFCERNILTEVVNRAFYQDVQYIVSCPKCHMVLKTGIEKKSKSPYYLEAIKEVEHVMNIKLSANTTTEECLTKKIGEFKCLIVFLDEISRLLKGMSRYASGGKTGQDNSEGYTVATYCQLWNGDFFETENLKRSVEVSEPRMSIIGAGHTELIAGYYILFIK